MGMMSLQITPIRFPFLALISHKFLCAKSKCMSRVKSIYGMEMWYAVYADRITSSAYISPVNRFLNDLDNLSNSHIFREIN